MLIQNNNQGQSLNFGMKNVRLTNVSLPKHFEEAYLKMEPADFDLEIIGSNKRQSRISKLLRIKPKLESVMVMMRKTDKKARVMDYDHITLTGNSAPHLINDAVLLLCEKFKLIKENERLTSLLKDAEKRNEAL